MLICKQNDVPKFFMLTLQPLSKATLHKEIIVTGICTFSVFYICNGGLHLLWINKIQLHFSISIKQYIEHCTLGVNNLKIMYDHSSFLEPRSPTLQTIHPNTKMMHEIKQDCKLKLAPDLKLLAVANFLTFSLVLVC